jgi:hypothetical protein
MVATGIAVPVTYTVQVALTGVPLAFAVTVTLTLPPSDEKVVFWGMPETVSRVLFAFQGPRDLVVSYTRLKVQCTAAPGITLPFPSRTRALQAMLGVDVEFDSVNTN